MAIVDYIQNGGPLYIGILIVVGYILADSIGVIVEEQA
jgi:hypothetical protein